MEVFCDQETEGGGWIQCAGWQSRLDEDHGNVAFYPRDMFVNTYNDRSIVDGNNDEYWGIDCADIFKQTESTELMYSSTTGDYWAFGLPTTLNNIDNFYQIDSLNSGTLNDSPPTNMRTNTSLTDFRVDFDGNCAYGTGGHQWHILCLQTIHYRKLFWNFLSLFLEQLEQLHRICVQYHNTVSCGDDLFGADCEDEWTYLYVR